MFPAAITAAIFAKSIASRVFTEDSLLEFRVGSLALSGESKTGELVLPFVFFGALLAVSILVFNLVRNDRLNFTYRQLIIVESILALPAVVPFVLGLGGPLLEIIDSPVLLSLFLQAPPAVFVLALHKNYRSNTGSKQDHEVIVPTLWLMASLPFAFLGLVVGIRYIISPNAFPWTFWVVLIETAIVVSAITVARLLPRIHFQSFLVVGWLFAVLATSALILLFPPLMELRGNSVVLPGLDPMAWRLFLIMAGVIILGETFIRQRWGGGDRNWMATVSSFAVAALIVPLRGNYNLPAISSDDFHFGENFSPTILWQQFSQMPYVDVVLPRGFLPNLAPGIANALLNDGSAATHSYVYLVVAFCVVGISHVFLRSIVGFVPATVMIALVAIANSYLEGDLLVTALLIFAAGCILRRTNAFLLGLALATITAIAVLAYPLMGVASLAVLVGVTMFGTVGAVLGRSKDLRYASFLIVSFLISGYLIWLSPLGSPTRAAFQYVFVNASNNSEAFGIPLDMTWRSPFVLGQIMSMTFVLGAFVSLWILWVKRHELRTPGWTTYAAIGISAIPALFVLGLSGRYLGRINPSEFLNRAGQGSIIVIGLITPAVLFMFKKASFTRVACALIAVASVISLAMVPIGGGGLLRSSLGLLEAPANWMSTNEVQEVPRLGYGQRDETHIASLLEIRSISINLPFGEPVLNLSNRGTLYGYMGWSNPLGYLAPYNIPNAREEHAAIDRLAANPPRITFIGPGPQWDGISLTLRNPLLARWVMDNYTPLECGSTTWAIHDSIKKDQRKSLLNCPGIDSAPSIENATLWATSIGAPSYLRQIPASWGARASRESIATINLYLTTTNAVADMQEFSIVIPELPKKPTTKRPDFLDLWVSCPANPYAHEATLRRSANLGNTVAKIKWYVNPETGSTDESTFDWGVGRFLIPLDAYPTWQRAQARVGEVLLTTPTIDCSEGWHVKASGRFR
jgi:hypothetical protein